MLTALPAEGQAPAIASKPGMSLRGFSSGRRTRTRGKGIKVALRSCGVHKEVPIGTAYAEKPVRLGNQAMAGTALVRFRPVAADCIQDRMDKRHFTIPGKGKN